MKEAFSANPHVYDKALSLVPEDKKSLIVDVGCGNGEFVNEMNKAGYSNIVCVDIEDNMKYDNSSLAIMDLNNDFLFEDNTFDVVSSLAIIEHLENPRHFLRQCKRILKPGGYIILSTPSIEHFKARLKFMLKGVLYGFDKRDYDISGHITPITSYDIHRICKELDLEIETFTYNDKKKRTMIVKLKKKD